VKGEKRESEREERKWKVRARQGGERKEVDTVGEVRREMERRETVRVEGRREEETVRGRKQ
jgi:hypothetical protein